MRNNSFRKNNVIISGLIYFFINIFICTFGVLKIINKNYSNVDIKIWSAIGFFIFIFAVATWVKIEKDLFNEWFIFLSLCYMYWFGQSFLYLFNILPELSEINTYNTDSLCKALIYQCMGFSLMHLGAIIYKIFSGKGNYEKRKINKFEDRDLQYSINRVAGVMFIISAPIVLVDLFNKINISISAGYLALYKNENSLLSSLADSLSMPFIAALFLLLAANKDNKNRKKIILSIFLVYIVVFLAIGGRSVAMGLIVCLALFNHKQIKEFRGKRFIKLIIIVIIIMILIPLVGELRGAGNKNLVETFMLIKEENMFISTINSMGFSIFPMVKTMEIIPYFQGYSWGIEYIATIFAIIPSIFLFGFSFAELAALPDWLKIFLNMDYGPGYSIIAESYYNFGWAGLIIMFIIGYLIQIVFKNKKHGSEKIFKDAIICIVLYFFTLVIRNSLLLLFRNLFYFVLIPIAFIKLIYIKRKG